MPTISILWRRLDTPGHDACRLQESEAGWRLEGTAVFRHDGVPASLAYSVACDRAWRTTRGEIRGWTGDRPVSALIARTAEGAWTLNGSVVPGLERLVDLDLGFTPATNLPQLRRIALAEGQAAVVPVAWFDVATGGLEVLPQRYDRRSETTYWYEAPSVEYAGLLEVAPSGFIRRYPGLWEAEEERGSDAIMTMRPKELVRAWVEAFNRVDVDALAGFYDDTAINHQVAESPVEGREAIRRMFADGFAAAKMVCIPENLFEDGEWAILKWRDPLGLRGCGFFHVVNGKIVFQRGYWDKLTFLRQHGLPVPS